MVYRHQFLPALVALICTHSALAFECSLSADSATATVVKPSGESLRLGIRKEKDCQGIRVSSGSVRIVYAGQSGLQESVLAAGAVINPDVLKPVTNSGYQVALRQLGLILAGDEKQRPGMLRSAQLQSEDYAEILPHGDILWRATDMVIVIPTHDPKQITELEVTDDNGRAVPLHKVNNGYRIAHTDFSEGASYRWSTTIDGNTLRGRFTLSTAQRAEQVEHTAHAALVSGSGASSAWRDALNKATSLATQGFVWDAGRIIRESL
ncbi:hypothetical protein [Noviherbaspirillum autotrophicum]|uniref:hypothetical protein n=1 Tax=Noviherbaspirillum autotrophicum TaxID=709839 RepID=UPI0012FE56EC|nr:hypothetical protein [Noviherbaspirillum autotrophicum]